MLDELKPSEKVIKSAKSVTYKNLTLTILTGKIGILLNSVQEWLLGR